MNTIIIGISEVMLWSSIPLLVGLSIWEHGLVLSESNQTIMQIIMVALVFRWAWFWFSFGEKRRYEHWIRLVESTRGRTDLQVYPDSAEDQGLNKVQPFQYRIRMGEPVFDQLPGVLKQRSDPIHESRQVDVWFD